MRDIPGPIDPDAFDADAFLAKLNRWASIGGDETGPPESWVEALELLDEAFRVLADDLTLEEALIAFADAYAAVVAHHLD